MRVDHGEKSRQLFDRPGAVLFIAQASTIDAGKKYPHILCLIVALNGIQDENMVIKINTWKENFFNS